MSIVAELYERTSSSLTIKSARFIFLRVRFIRQKNVYQKICCGGNYFVMEIIFIDYELIMN